MAGELLAALNQVETDVATLTDVQRAQLGQLLKASEATKDKSVAAVYLMTGSPLNDALTSTKERHRVEVKFYWLVTPINVEVVEQSVATMWDRVMTLFFGDDADRNLTEKATIALVSGEDGVEPYQTGYEDIGGKVHRVLVVPLEIELDTHSV